MTRHAPRILLRADATPELGGGHVMRCLALARALDDRGADIAFAAGPGSTDVAPALARSGIALTVARGAADFDLPAGWDGRADAVFVDLYTSTAADETRMREHANLIAAIEDLPDRRHDCDILVDPLPGGSPFDYSGRVPEACNIMAGGAFALIRPEFAQCRPLSLERHRKETRLSRILVSMGLTDIGGVSEPVTRAVLASAPDAQVEVVLGPAAASRGALEALAAEDDRLSVLVDINDMAERMARAGLAVGAGGGTTLERCVLGLPSIAVVLAENQRAMTQLLKDDGALMAIDGPERIAEDLPQRIARLTPKARVRMTERAAAVCDGRGAGRVADAMLERIERHRAGVSAHA